MSDTFVNLSYLKRALYYKNIINAIPQFKYDKSYACLIMCVPPFNILMLVILPYLGLSQNEARKKLVNKFVLAITFSPIAVCVTCIYTAFNFCLLPFAFIKTLIVKGMIMFKNRKLQNVKEFFIFLTLGIPFLFMAQFSDLYWFCAQVYTWNLKRNHDYVKIRCIQRPIFFAFLEYL